MHKTVSIAIVSAAFVCLSGCSNPSQDAAKKAAEAEAAAKVVHSDTEWETAAGQGRVTFPLFKAAFDRHAADTVYKVRATIPQQKHAWIIVKSIAGDTITGTPEKKADPPGDVTVSVGQIEDWWIPPVGQQANMGGFTQAWTQ